MAGIPIYFARRYRGRKLESPPPSLPVVDRIGTGDGLVYERSWRVDEAVMPLDNGEFPPPRG
ncbi:hypothetical protein [Sphingopyxis sp.]|uniref:hypothetical protein n=1 Tax=Sphingopyxis sp. TaxID=1908224 RepID=UPI002B48C078|nr:hypothetical protein [Sphingopyxis sp.]HJS12729.1 hypothetical protein [Sphingopyxis sp.]